MAKRDRYAGRRRDRPLAAEALSGSAAAPAFLLAAHRMRRALPLGLRLRGPLLLVLAAVASREREAQRDHGSDGAHLQRRVGRATWRERVDGCGMHHSRSSE